VVPNGVSEGGGCGIVIVCNIVVLSLTGERTEKKRMEWHERDCQKKNNTEKGTLEEKNEDERGVKGGRMNAERMSESNNGEKSNESRFFVWKTKQKRGREIRRKTRDMESVNWKLGTQLRNLKFNTDSGVVFKLEGGEKRNRKWVEKKEQKISNLVEGKREME
jgi:hypothetical protein